MWQDLQRAIAYIEANLTEPLQMTNIAAQAHCSSFHFQRAFSLLTGMTVASYIRRRRLTKAAEDLQRTTNSVLTIALTYQYETPEAFTKAFKQQHKLSPRAARQHAAKLTLYNPLAIHVELKGVEPMNYRIEQKPAFTVIGNSYQLTDNTTIPELWEATKEDMWLPHNNGELQGMLGVCLPQASGMTYVIGVASTNPNFTPITIPASTWAVFEVIGAMPHAMTAAWERIYREWLPQSNYKLANTAEFERYTDDDPTSATCYSEIWLPVF